MALLLISIRDTYLKLVLNLVQLMTIQIDEFSIHSCIQKAVGLMRVMSISFEDATWIT